MTVEQTASVWKFIAITSIGIILGGAPGYATLALDHRASMTRADVDAEIDTRNGAIVQSIADLKDQLKEIEGKIDELSKVR